MNAATKKEFVSQIEREIANECDLPPFGWRCTRGKGHEGPCAAIETPEDVSAVASAMDRLRGATQAAPSTPAQASMPNEAQIDAYLDDYSFEGDTGSHTPGDDERAVIKDAIMGLLAAPSTPAAKVDCPHCFAKAGEPCLWPETRETNRDHPHKAREALAATQAQAYVSGVATITIPNLTKEQADMITTAINQRATQAQAGVDHIADADNMVPPPAA